MVGGEMDGTCTYTRLMVHTPNLNFGNCSGILVVINLLGGHILGVLPLTDTHPRYPIPPSVPAVHSWPCWALIQCSISLLKAAALPARIASNPWCPNPSPDGYHCTEPHLGPGLSVLESAFCLTLASINQGVMSGVFIGCHGCWGWASLIGAPFYASSPYDDAPQLCVIMYSNAVSDRNGAYVTSG